ncbi:MAG: tetratricopeptide repeat protein, partial [Gammaproteobacteria bacterium]|nr:tetratricopeptide repeat protein [Gammaproteobacteria bacterium]
AALQSYQAALAIAERLARADPGNSQWQRDLSVSHIKIGDVQRGQGSLTAALQSYQAALAIAERLARADPGNSQWQRDLSVSHIKIGDVQRGQGSLTAALQSYQAALAIAERLARVDPGNSQWQRDLAVSLERLAGFPNSGVSWQVVVDQYNKLQAAGTLLPGDVEFAEQARRRAQGSPP